MADSLPTVSVPKFHNIVFVSSAVDRDLVGSQSCTRIEVII